MNEDISRDKIIELTLRVEFILSEIIAVRRDLAVLDSNLDVSTSHASELDKRLLIIEKSEKMRYLEETLSSIKSKIDEEIKYRRDLNHKMWFILVGSIVSIFSSLLLSLLK